MGVGARWSGCVNELNCSHPIAANERLGRKHTTQNDARLTVEALSCSSARLLLSRCDAGSLAVLVVSTACGAKVERLVEAQRDEVEAQRLEKVRQEGRVAAPARPAPRQCEAFIVVLLMC